MTLTRTIWVLTEGIAGTENQCLGIAEALGGEVIVKRINLKFPWRIFSPYLRFGEGPAMLTRESDSVAPPYPDVLIAGGRKALGIARYIKQASAGRTRVCVVQNPKISPDDFDLVAAPVHDGLAAGPHVLLTDGAPNRMTPDKLDHARTKWAADLSALPAPRIAVLIGGKSKTFEIGEKEVATLCAGLRDLSTKQGASLMVTVSRRTPPALATLIKHALSPLPNTALFTGEGENPYLGFLAYADYIICTSDSTSMLSDAATTGKPVYLFTLPGGSPKFDRLFAHLRRRGVIKDFTIPPMSLESWGYPPFRDAARVAESLKTLLETGSSNN